MKKNNPSNEHNILPHFFWLFILAHTLIWTIGPAILRPTIPHDTLEGITWGLQWQWGYSKHPFLAAWLSAGFTQLFKVTGWPVYLLAQLAVSLSFLATWRIAHHLLPRLHAFIAALALEGVLFYSINSFNFTPDTLQSPLWALLSLFIYRATKNQRIHDWLWSGLFAVLCVVTKYQAVMLLIPLFLFCLVNPKARQSFKHVGIYLALILFIMLLLPHLFWLMQHDFITLHYANNVAAEYTSTKSPLNHLTYPLGFLINCLIQTLGVFILFWPFYKEKKTILKPHAFDKQFLGFITLGPFLGSLMICIILGDYFPPRWATPYFFPLGIALMGCLKPTLTPKTIKQFIITLILFSSLLFIGRMTTWTILPRANSDAFLPNQQIARTLSHLWQQHSQKPLPFLAGSHYLTAGIIPYMKDKPAPYLSWNPKTNPWINEAEFIRQGGLIIWDKDGFYTWDELSKQTAGVPLEIFKRFPGLEQLPDYVFYRLSDNKPLTIGVALLHPAEDSNHLTLR